MHVIVGLGNPGEEYENTRHNVGRSVLVAFATEKGFPEWEFNKKINALVTEGKVAATTENEKKPPRPKKRAGGEDVVMLLPETFMNKSGNAVKNYVTSPKKAETLIVVHDDMDLPRGIIKISYGRGAGGHHGVESIIRAVKTKNFTRIRIGVSEPAKGGAVKKPKGEKKILDFLVKDMEKGHLAAFSKIATVVCEALTTMVTEGRAIAMNNHN